MAAGQGAGPTLQVDAGRTLAPSTRLVRRVALRGHSGTLGQARDLAGDGHPGPRLTVSPAPTWRSEHGEQGQEHEEEHGKETGSKEAEREAAGQEGKEVAERPRPSSCSRVIPELWPLTSAGCTPAVAGATSYGRGKVSTNSAPPPRVERTSSAPLIRSASSRAMYRPRPVPLGARASFGSLR